MQKKKGFFIRVLNVVDSGPSSYICELFGIESAA